MELERVRIAVVGDSGVGKSSLVEWLCRELPLRYPRATTGCSIEILIHSFQRMNGKDHFVEILEVGGYSKHVSSRSVFYNGINGIIVVHDLENKKSYKNLRKWLREANIEEGGLKSRRSSSLGNLSSSAGAKSLAQSQALNAGNMADDYVIKMGSMGSDLYASQGLDVPVLVVGTKLDLIAGQHFQPRVTECELSIEYQGLSIEVNTQVPRSQSGEVATTIKQFYDRVIEKKFFAPPPQNHSSITSPIFSSTTIQTSPVVSINF